MELAQERLQAQQESLGLGLGHAEKDRRHELFCLAVDSVESRAPLIREPQDHSATIAWVSEALHEVAADQFVRYSSGEGRRQGEALGKLGHGTPVGGADSSERRHPRVRQSERLARGGLLDSEMRRRVSKYRHKATDVFRVMRHGAAKLPILR
jgi:hypothetical protein